MSAIDQVVEFLKEKGYEDRIKYFHNTDITAASTAEAIGVSADRICKGLAFKAKSSRCIIILASGKARIDNNKFKNTFGFRPSMISAESCEELTGYKSGSINPFYLKDGAALYFDISIRKHLGETVFPGIGDEDHVVELSIPELEKLVSPKSWVDVTK